jgi:hypothetical protein
MADSVTVDSSMESARTKGGYARRRHDWPHRLGYLLLRDHAEHGSLHRATCQR